MTLSKYPIARLEFGILYLCTTQSVDINFDLKKSKIKYCKHNASMQSWHVLVGNFRVQQRNLIGINFAQRGGISACSKVATLFNAKTFTNSNETDVLAFRWTLKACGKFCFGMFQCHGDRCFSCSSGSLQVKNLPEDRSLKYANNRKQKIHHHRSQTKAEIAIEIWPFLGLPLFRLSNNTNH